MPQVYVDLARGAQRPLDLICCLDSSVSVGAGNFQKAAEFLECLCMELEMPPTQVGVIQFHHKFNVVSTLTDDRLKIMSRIHSMTFEAGETQMAPPLQHAGKLFDQSKRVREHWIDDAARVMLIVTDGKPNDLSDTESVVNTLKDDGVRFIFLQVGDREVPKSIYKFASYPHEHHVFAVHSFEELPRVMTDVLRTVLNLAAIGYRMPERMLHSSEHEIGVNLDVNAFWDVRKVASTAAATSTIHVAEVSTQSEAMLYAELTRGSQCPLDLVCCLDSSVSVGEVNFAKGVLFMERLIDKLEMPPVQVGVLRFNQRCTVVAPLGHDRDHMKNCVRNMTYEPGETALGPPLMWASNMLAAGVPQTRRQAVIIISDGDPGDKLETQAASQKLKDAGVIIIVVRVGDISNHAMLQRLASHPSEEHIVNVRNYDELIDAIAKVLRLVVQISRWVRRAKLSLGELGLPPYEVVEDIATMPGQELLVPGWELDGNDSFMWRPSAGHCLQDPKSVSWDADPEPFQIIQVETADPQQVKLQPLQEFHSASAMDPQLILPNQQIPAIQQISKVASQPLLLNNPPGSPKDVGIIGIPLMGLDTTGDGQANYFLTGEDRSFDSNTAALLQQGHEDMRTAALLQQGAMQGNVIKIGDRYRALSERWHNGGLLYRDGDCGYVTRTTMSTRGELVHIKWDRSSVETAEERATWNKYFAKVMDGSEIPLLTMTLPQDAYYTASQSPLTVPSATQQYSALHNNAAINANALRSEDVMSVKRCINERFGNLTLAFDHFDDNKSKILTATKLKDAFARVGWSRQLAETMFNRLLQQAGCVQRGALALEDWLRAFDDATATGLAVTGLAERPR